MPLIKKESERQIKKLHEAGNKLVGFDSALIIEAGEADRFRPLIVVHCDPQTQISRMMRRNLLTYDEAVARLRAQLPREEKIKIADFVIDSSGSIENTAKKALEIIRIIRKTYL